MSLADRSAEALDSVTSALPAGEDRPGQRDMARAVADAIEQRRHLIVQAGTGTGKSLAYLVPAIVSGRTTVVATATKALQDQLAAKDLPFLAEQLSVSYAVLKGRSNYLCAQRLHEATTSDAQLGLDGIGPRRDTDELADLALWAATTDTGDRGDVAREPSSAVWSAVSVGPRECPGAARCPRGQECFAERARDRAAAADVVVVNLHLYGLHVASGGMLLPEHDVVVIDEAHQFEDTISATAGRELSGRRFAALARNTRAIIADDALVADLEAAGDRLDAVLGDHLGRRLKGALDPDLADAIALGRSRVERVLSALRAIDDDAPGDAGARKQRAMKAATSLVDDADAVLDLPASEVAWVEGFADAPVLSVAPIDVAPVLDRLWESATPHTVVLTSATIPTALGARLGVAADTVDELDVGSPFDYEANALLYCAAHLPDPRASGFDEAMVAELEALVVAAGGRTLSLFTSYRAMDLAADALRDRVPHPILTQNDLPKAALLERFGADEATCLFATMSFWQGVDIPGRSLSLVTIDRLPFPRPDEPLLQARRERAREAAFRTIDLPRAATLLAQGAGRLIRTATDRGVVAVLDPRLATNARYRWDVVRALPPMRRTRDRAEAEAFLRTIADGEVA